MILVVGGTGRLGRTLVPMLVSAGHPVRVMARGVSQPFPDAAGNGVELLKGDLASEADCVKAVAGCAKVVFAASGFGLRGADPRGVDRDGAIRLVQAAAAAEVGHVVMMSMHGAAQDGPIEYLRCKAAAEESVRTSGTEWTIIRIGALLEQRLEIMTAPLESKGRVLVLGSGSAPVTYTSVRDAAALVVRALSDPALRNRVIEWGSQTLSANELAEAVLARLGQGSTRRVPAAAERFLSIAAKPFSPFLARMAEAGVWEESGAAAFDFADGRAELADIPVNGLPETLQTLLDQGGQR
jgi:uncharacterized protein YbjT (DUF2867 family)